MSDPKKYIGVAPQFQQLLSVLEKRFGLNKKMQPLIATPTVARLNSEKRGLVKGVHEGCIAALQARGGDGVTLAGGAIGALLTAGVEAAVGRLVARLKL